MPELTRQRKTDLLAISLLTLLCVLLFADVLLGQRDFFIRDLTRYYHPTKSILREIVMSGEFPWWNPFYSAGQPIAANPEYEVFYPLQWLIFIPDFDLGFRLHILVHIWIAAIGMYAFLRSLRLDVWAALFGAISWGFGGLMMSLINLLPILFAASWMPLVFLFARRAMRRFTMRDVAAASSFAGLQILVGEPTTLVQTWLVIGFYGLWRMVRLRRFGWRAFSDPAAIIFLMLVWSVAIGSIQLIPAIDHAGDTVRARGFDYDLVTAWSFPPQRALELVYPHFFGRMNVDGRTVYWAGSGLYDRPASPFLFSIYPGAMVAALLLAGLLTTGSGRARWALFVAPFVVVAMGRHLPFFEWLIDAGVEAPFRYPEKFLLSAAFGTVVFSSLSFGRIARGDRRLVRRGAMAMLGFALVSAFVSLVSLTSLYERAFVHLWGVDGSRFRDVMVAASRSDWLVATLVTGATATVLFLRGRTRSTPAWSCAAIVVLVVDLIPVGLDAAPRIQSSFFDAPPIVETFPERQDDFRIFHEVDWYGRSRSARSWYSTGRGVYWVVRNGLFPMTPGNHGFRTVLERDYDRTALLPTVDLVRSMWDVRDGGQKEWASIFMKMSNARYRARYEDLRVVLESFDGDWREVRPVRFEEIDTLPRYYLASRVVRIENREDFVRSLIDSVPDEKTVFVRFEPFDPAGGTVEVISETHSAVRLRVEATGRSFLVLGITPHRYWRAEVDGQRVELHEANIGYQGLIVREGVSEIELRYRNPLVIAMAPVSVSALIFAMGLAGFRRRVRDSDGVACRGNAAAEARAERVEEHLSRVAADRDA